MRNDKGFTFVELIAVLVIIVILFIVSFPPIMKALKNTQIKIDNGVMQIIEDGTNDLLVDETSAYDNKDTNKYCIKINDLIKKGYVSEEIAKDINKDAYSVVTFEKNKPKIEIHTECIEEINDLYFALNGNKEININLGSTYSDLGVIAYDKNGNSLINNVNINIMDEKLVTQDSVDTSKVGTYIIE